MSKLITPDSLEATQKEIEKILDNHAEYYIKQTVKFFQENGESPALSKNNKGDLEAKTKLIDLIIGARIDELENFKRLSTLKLFKDVGPEYHINARHIEYRLQELKAQLNTYRDGGGK